MAPTVSSPAYLRIRNELLELIRCGAYRSCDRLPSETELQRRFNVSRVTVRLALEALRRKGVVRSQQGKGSFVCMPKVVHQTPALLGFHEAIEGRGYATGSRVLSVNERSACHDVAHALQLRRKASVLEVRRLRCVNDQRVSLDVSHFPVDVGAKLLREDLTGDIFSLLERRCGVPLGRADVSIEAVACDADTALDLQLQPKAPLLHVRRLTWSTNGRPTVFEHLYCRGDAWQYGVQLNCGRP
ncbi:MAG: GntR family transcriptional regulator [Betaproteobacteria bacterium]|nr:GntR family transcriptional regulator [Betaproteobacteria bacterium]